MRAFLGFVLNFVVVFAVFGQQANDFHSQQITLPELTGSYHVGRKVFDWIDESRREPYSSNPKTKREMMVWIWYPASAKSTSQPAVYLPGKWGKLVAEKTANEAGGPSTTNGHAKFVRMIETITKR